MCSIWRTQYAATEDMNYYERRRITLKLCEIGLGDKVRVTEISKRSSITRRLLDIGLIPGTNVECVLVSPMKNPKAYMIRGAVIAIRNEDAGDIMVEKSTCFWGTLQKS